jgi:CHAT domain-containing protein/tetratricopeptide (TPR) repeat protein
MDRAITGGSKRPGVAALVAAFIASAMIGTLPSIARAAEIVAAPGSTHTGKLDSAQPQRFRVELDAGQAIEMSARQSDDAAIELRWNTLGASTPRILQTEVGRSARLHVTLVAEAASVWTVEIAASAAGKAASYGFTLGQVHTAAVADRARASAAELFSQAQALRHAEDKDAATRAATAYEAAIAQARQAQDSCALRQIHVALAGLRHDTGDAAGQGAAARAALQSVCADDLAEQALAERLLGSAYINQGNFAAGVGATERAVALFHQTADMPNQALALRNLGLAYAESGEVEKALATTRSALKLAETVGDRRLQITTRGDIAFQLNARGEYAAAIEAYRQTLDDLRAMPNPMTESVARINLGIAYGQLGDVDEAARAYAASETAATAAGCWSCLAEIAADQGDTLLDNGKPDEAAVAYRRALDIATEHQLLRQRAEAQRGLGRCAMAAQDWTQARSLLESARVELHRTHAVVNEAVVQAMLGDLENHQGHLAAARQNYLTALTLARQAANQTWQTVAKASLARIAEQGGDLDGARRYIESAVAAIESERARINAPDLRTSYFGTMRSYFELYVDILMQLDHRQPGQGHAAAALIVAERARARALQDQLTERAINVDKDIDAALLAQEHAAADHLHALAYRLGESADDAKTRVALQAGIDEASRQLDQARGRMRAANPRYAELVHPTALTLSEIRRTLLDDDVSVLEYWLGEQRSYLWLLTRNTVDGYILPPRRQIEQAAGALRDKLAAGAAVAAGASMEQLVARGEAETAAIRTLARHLIEQSLPDAVQARLRPTLVIVADGELQSLPLGLVGGLRDDVAATSAADSIVAYLPSLGSLRGLRMQQRSSRDRGALAILADPVFRADDSRVRGREAALAHASDASLLRSQSVDGVGALQRLPNTRAEAQAIAALATPAASWVALDFAANRQAALAATWSNYASVHFATHALVNPVHPELSGIVLSLYDANGNAEDGFLRMNDIYNLHMPVELVVLSVCESALGKNLGAEGISSLARGFFYAGAQRVVASLWPVDDRASAALMQAFYRGLLQRGETPARALIDAQREVRADPRWQSPFYWAGFVLQGDWR